MKETDKLEHLKKVQKVEAPPFLWTRIQAQLNKAATERLSPTWQWAGALAFSLLLLLNWKALSTAARNTPPSVATLAAEVQLQPTHQLYDE